MDRRISLHIGVWSPTRCAGSPTLDGPHCDPCIMASIAEAEGFEERVVLLGDEAVRDAVLTAIRDAAQATRDGGTFLITFSGHGRQSAAYATVQTWCLANHEFTDAELLAELVDFSDQARVLVVSASCHSGGFGSRPVMLWLRKHLRRFFVAAGLARPMEVQLPEINEIADPQMTVKASVLYLASCSSDEESRDEKPLTLFTRILRDVWNGGQFTGSYKEFIEMVAAGVRKENSKQNPVLGYAGEFPEWYKKERPFIADPPVGGAPLTALQGACAGCAEAAHPTPSHPPPAP